MAVLAALYVFEPEEAPRDRLERARIEVGDAPQSIGAGSLGVWVVEGGDRALRQIDVATNEPGPQVDLGRFPGGIALGGDAVWVGFIQGSSVKRFDPTAGESDRALRSVRTGETPQSLAAGEGAIWVGGFDDGTITRIDEVSVRPSDEPLQLENGFPGALAVGFESVWIADVVGDEVIRLDADTGDIVARIPVGTAPTAIAAGEGGVWVANLNDRTVSHIDPETNAPAGPPIIVGGQPAGVAVGEGYVWVTRPEDDSVIRIDPERSEWTGEVFKVGDAPQGVAVGAGSIWTADQGSDTVTRLTPVER